MRPLGGDGEGLGSSGLAPAVGLRGGWGPPPLPHQPAFDVSRASAGAGKEVLACARGRGGDSPPRSRAGGGARGPDARGGGGRASRWGEAGGGGSVLVCGGRADEMPFGSSSRGGGVLCVGAQAAMGGGPRAGRGPGRTRVAFRRSRRAVTHRESRTRRSSRPSGALAAPRVRAASPDGRWRGDCFASVRGHGSDPSSLPPSLPLRLPPSPPPFYLFGRGGGDGGAGEETMGPLGRVRGLGRGVSLLSRSKVMSCVMGGQFLSRLVAPDRILKGRGRGS